MVVSFFYSSDETKYIYSTSMLLKAWLCHSLLDMKLCSGTLSRIVCAVSEDRMRRCKKHLSQGYTVCLRQLSPSSLLSE